MEEYKKSFINFMVDSHVLKFGEFTLKSGRKSPFFMNAGAYKTGSQLIKLGEYYARAINDKFGLEFDVLFGPAYKGIPLAVATVMAISDRVMIIEDVTTSGASIAETVPIIRAQADVDIVGLIVSLDRREGRITASRPARSSPWTRYRSISITGRSTAKSLLTRRSRNLLIIITRSMA